jgi:hypothetical protein
MQPAQEQLLDVRLHAGAQLPAHDGHGTPCHRLGLAQATFRDVALSMSCCCRTGPAPPSPGQHPVRSAPVGVVAGEGESDVIEPDEIAHNLKSMGAV